MSREIISKEIDQILETITEQWDIIRGYNEKIPLIEMDILMGNVRKLYDDLYLLDKLSKTPGFDPDKIRSQITRGPSIIFDAGIKPKPAFDEPKDKTLVEKSKSMDTIVEPKQELFVTKPESVAEAQAYGEPETSESESAILEVETHPESERHAPKTVRTSKDEMQNIQDEPPLSKAVEESKAPKKPVQMPVTDLFGTPVPTLADKYTAEKKSIKDQLVANGKVNSLGSRMQQGQISNLKTAIGINDKFLFINELFKGDLAGYNRAIENLNACQTLSEASEKLNEMRVQYKWSESSSSFSRLNDFLKRRFTP